jgi:hypothetical protein
MSALHLRNRADSLCALLASAVASVAVLGAAVLLFAGAGSTPAFDPSSRMAQRASACSQAPSIQARHQCLRDVASMPAQSVTVAERGKEQLLP